jgi:electron transport complex protein RnfG
MSDSLKMLVVLSAITLASGVALGGLFELTHERAANNVLKFKKIPAVIEIHSAVSGELDSDARTALEADLLENKKLVDIGAAEPLLVFVVNKDGKPHAVAIEGFGQGFGGDLGVMAGIALADEELIAIGITTMGETPGIGTRVRDADFTKQFAGKDKQAVIKVKKEGGEIDAVSGATISSRAVTDGVRAAQATYNEHKAAIEQAITP